MVVPSLSWQIFGVSVEQGLQKGDFRTGHASSLMKLGLPDASAASHTASAISAEKARSPQRFVCLSRVCLGKQTVFSVNNGSKVFAAPREMCCSFQPSTHEVVWWPSTIDAVHGYMAAWRPSPPLYPIIDASLCAASTVRVLKRPQRTLV